jgi:hypothetical protein
MFPPKKSFSSFGICTILIPLPLIPAISSAALSVQTSVIPMTIPGNDPRGCTSVVSISHPLTVISSVEVLIDKSGGWSGDVYAYLAHGDSFSVLLNRPGRSAMKPDGFGATSMLVSLGGSNLPDVHTAIPDTGHVTGAYAVDGRNVDPPLVSEVNARSAFWDSFDGLAPNGQWTLFIADMAAGNTMILNAWSLRVEAAPEPSLPLLRLVSCLLL